MNDNPGIYLLSRETVFVEMAELARNKIAGVLKVHPKAILVEATVGETGGVGMKFSVSARAAEGLDRDQIQLVMSSVYRVVKADLEERLVGIQEEWRP